MIENVNIPEERKGALIGKDGSVKAEIENRTKTRIDVSEGVVIEGEDPIAVIKSSEIVKAIGRGFSPEKAMLLLREDYELRVITLQGESEKTIKRLMARVIGSRGATRKIIEHDTNCLVSVYGKTVSIIGKTDEITAAEDAVENILKGRSHGFVYSRLRK